MWAGHKPPTVPGPHPPPSSRTMAETQPVATAGGGGGGHEQEEEGKGGVQGEGPPGPPPALIPHLAPSVSLIPLLPSWVSGQKGRRKARRGGEGFLPEAPISACLGRGSVWLLLKAGNKELN